MAKRTYSFSIGFPRGKIQCGFKTKMQEKNREENHQETESRKLLRKNVKYSTPIVENSRTMAKQMKQRRLLDLFLECLCLCFINIIHYYHYYFLLLIHVSSINDWLISYSIFI